LQFNVESYSEQLYKELYERDSGKKRSVFKKKSRKPRSKYKISKESFKKKIQKDIAQKKARIEQLRNKVNNDE
jgi:hypothetical protein